MQSAIAQLNAIYAGAPFALCFVDLKRRYVSANKKFAELIGVHLEHIIGRRVDEVCPHALPFVIADLKAAMNGRRPPPLESVTPDGNRIILSTIAAAHDENNEVVGISVALIDITKYKTSIPMRAFGRRGSGSVTMDDNASARGMTRRGWKSVDECPLLLSKERSGDASFARYMHVSYQQGTFAEQQLPGLLAVATIVSLVLGLLWLYQSATLTAADLYEHPGAESSAAK